MAAAPEARRAREAEEKAERARKEAEEKARREQEELKRKLEEERKAREEAERRAKEEAERARRELEEERRKLEAERKQREEEGAREEAERATRRQREEQEEQERRAQRDAEEEAERAARRKQRDEEEERERAERDSRRRAEEEQARVAKPKDDAPPPPPKKAAATGDAFADSLLADLDSFTQKDDEERKAKEEADRKAKEEVTRKRQEEVERAERAEQEARQRDDEERSRKEAEAQRARDEEERRARKQREEQEQAEREAEERRRKVAAASGAIAPAAGDDLGITDDDLELDEVKKEAALLEKKKNRKEEREKEREKEKAQKRDREREAKSKKEKEKEEKEAKKSAAAYRPRRKSNLGRNLFLGLILLAIVGAGVLHVLPLSTAEYEKAASEALSRPVKIASGRFSMIHGVHYQFDNVSIGDLNVPKVRAYPELGSIFGERKVFSRIELEGMSLPQEALGQILFAKGTGDSISVSQLSLKNLKLAGALPLPPLDGEVQLAGGAFRSATLRGPEGLVAKLGAKDQSIEFDVNTTQMSMPFAPAITLVQFAMKGEATRGGMKITQWDGLLFSGHVTGTANVRWGDSWSIEGVMTARGVNAAVFAPALVSNGRAEGTGRFSMSGVEPAKLGPLARLEGNFTVSKGVLGSFDLSRALQTGGRQVTGQTQFAEMSGQGSYDRGAISLRNINLAAGALNAGASADVGENGALSGRIVADVKTSTQNLRSTLIMGGTVQEPQVRN
jgi:hypothetical protein